MRFLFITTKNADNSQLENLFKTKFDKHELTISTSPSEAINMITYSGAFSGLFIDCELKEVSPNHLASNLIELLGNKPIIFIGPRLVINERIDEEIFRSHEQNELLERPYDPAQIIHVLSNLIDYSAEEHLKDSIQEIKTNSMLPMKIRNFYLFNEIAYDVYLRLTEEQFINIISKDTYYSHSLINSYAKKQVKELYLFKDDYLKLLEESVVVIKTKLSLIRSSQIEKSLDLQVKAITITHQYIRSIGVSDSILELTDIMVSISMENWKKLKSLPQFVVDFPYLRRDYAEQSVLTIYVCLAMSHFLNWNSEFSTNKLVLASILQDSTLEQEEWSKIISLSDPAFVNLCESDRNSFLNHSLEASQVAMNFRHFPDVDFIVAQHHLRPYDGGFPKSISSTKMTMISCLFNLAATFSSMLLKEGTSKSSIKKIFEELEDSYKFGNFREPLEALGKQLNLKK